MFKGLKPFLLCFFGNGNRAIEKKGVKETNQIIFNMYVKNDFETKWSGGF